MTTAAVLFALLVFGCAWASWLRASASARIAKADDYARALASLRRAREGKR